jgi:hypothetical protein
MASCVAESWEISNSAKQRQPLAIAASDFWVQSGSPAAAARMPFDLMAGRPDYASWLAFVDTVRTGCFAEVLALAPMLPRAA